MWCICQCRCEKVLSTMNWPAQRRRVARLLAAPRLARADPHSVALNSPTAPPHQHSGERDDCSALVPPKRTAARTAGWWSTTRLNRSTLPSVARGRGPPLCTPGRSAGAPTRRGTSGPARPALHAPDAGNRPCRMARAPTGRSERGNHPPRRHWQRCRQCLDHPSFCPFLPGCAR